VSLNNTQAHKYLDIRRTKMDIERETIWRNVIARSYYTRGHTQVGDLVGWRGQHGQRSVPCWWPGFIRSALRARTAHSTSDRHVGACAIRCVLSGYRRWWVCELQYQHGDTGGACETLHVRRRYGFFVFLRVGIESKSTVFAQLHVVKHPLMVGWTVWVARRII